MDPGPPRDTVRSVLARRDEFMRDVPPRYRGEVHFAVTNLLSIGILWLAVRGVSHPTWRDLAFGPVAFVFANYFEWRLHRGPLHHRTRAAILYERHTLLHHAAFREDTMSVRNLRELRLVLFPWPALFAAALVDLPLLFVIGWLVSPNAGRIFFAVAFGYYLLYEWCHLAYHMPGTSWLARNALTRWLRTTHTRHHDPRRMLHKNFNVTFPLFDMLLGTLDREREPATPVGGRHPSYGAGSSATQSESNAQD
jgi:sterol desaturase/sphingolipid hydroxylase (fatty acid hydroxylase superfamily)